MTRMLSKLRTMTAQIAGPSPAYKDSANAYPIYISKRLREKNEKMLTSSFIGSHKTSHYATGIQGINQILSDYNLFKQFMSYLVYEFCAENVLFLVELVTLRCSVFVCQHSIWLNTYKMYRCLNNITTDSMCLKICLVEYYNILILHTLHIYIYDI